MDADPATPSEQDPHDNRDDVLDQSQRARDAAIAALTTAARLRGPDARQLDFAEFLAGVLASVAANVGRVDQLLAGRPGSWEADGVAGLLRGALGHNDEYLRQHRTEPVVLHLDVPSLVEDCSQGVTYERQYVALDHELGEVQAGLTDDALEAHEHEVNRRFKELRVAWQQRYQRYADAFVVVVHSEAARLELTVPVQVIVNTDPEAHPHFPPSPDETLDPVDTLAAQLWTTGLRQAAPWPSDAAENEANGADARSESAR